MAKARGLRTILNLLLVLVLLITLWIGLGQPLPWKWAYRRMERALFLEPMTILHHAEDDTVLAADNKHLALYIGDFWNIPLNKGDLYLFPLENDVGCAFRKDYFYGMDVWAYDASGQSTRVDMELKIWYRDSHPLIIREAAQLEHGFFSIHIDGDKYDQGINDWKSTALTAMIAAETGARVSFGDWEDFESGYAMTLTFFDDAGNVTEVHEREGTYDEN